MSMNPVKIQLKSHLMKTSPNVLQATWYVQSYNRQLQGLGRVKQRAQKKEAVWKLQKQVQKAEIPQRLKVQLTLNDEKKKKSAGKERSIFQELKI